MHPAPLPDNLGEFAIEHELGRGGSGVVYAARMSGRDVALKVLRADDAATPKERHRFLSEARNLARVAHPGVVRVLAVGELPDGRPYLAMERLHGGTLADRVSLGGRLGVEHALVLFEQLASAVGALHAAGLVHRDIKPENIMIEGDRLILLDFGIARDVDDLPSTTTQAGLQRGTPAYMAPERFFGARATVSSDVYETAVVLYVMVTGGLPWEPASPKDRMSPKPPSARGVTIPPGLERALMAALAVEPLHRPASIDALLASIRGAAWEGETRAAPPAATTERTRSRGVVVGIGLTAAAAAAIVVALVMSSTGGGGGKAGAAGTTATTAAKPKPATKAKPSGGKAAAVVTPLAVDAGVAAAATADAGAAAAAAAPADAGAAADAKGRPKKKAGTGTGTGTGTGAGTGAGTGTGAGSSAAAPGKACAKIAALYCTDEFKATEGTMAGALCTSMTKNVTDWASLPADARADQETWCANAYDQMAAAVAERLRMFKEGIGPPATK